MKTFAKLLLFIFLIMSAVGIVVQYSRVSEYKSVTNEPYYNNTTKANASTWQKHEQDGLNSFILILAVCGCGLFLLSLGKKSTPIDEEVIQPQINEKVLKKTNPILPEIVTIIKQNKYFKIGTLLVLLLTVVLIVGAVHKYSKVSTAKSASTTEKPIKTYLRTSNGSKLLTSTDDISDDLVYIEHQKLIEEGTRHARYYKDLKKYLDKIKNDVDYGNTDIDTKTIKNNSKYFFVKLYTSSYLKDKNDTKNQDNICITIYTPNFTPNYVVVYNELTEKYGIITDKTSLQYIDSLFYT